MTSRLNPYLGFRDDARQALKFYRSVFGGDLRIGTFAEMGAVQDPADADKIMHGQLETTRGYVLMASDTPSSMSRSDTNNISMSLSGDGADAADLRGYFAALSDAGTVLEPLTQAPWGDEFGMVTDRFGITWLVNITVAPSTPHQPTPEQPEA
ncbi:VOC family protein [Curtobacterium sp. MCPF17_011]|uniref:VOC family protein n=1 Tax=Curtobacterium sp. MCPF17_011 TaxID=2175652 RepID=UPI000DA6DCEA|nr:VOC family protein [Curtobacterium sp. MCPF17_011]PZF09506.1 VOC family protein [Curtobacterium sp. MCPF17_011]